MINFFNNKKLNQIYIYIYIFFFCQKQTSNVIGKKKITNKHSILSLQFKLDVKIKLKVTKYNYMK